MLTVWGRKSSSNVQVVMWCIAELGIEVNRIDAGFVYGVTDTAEYLAVNPNGTVPTIKDGDNPPLWESCAILRYVAQVYSNDAFWPKDPAQRSQVDMWAEWSKLSIASNFTSPIFWPAVRTPKERRDIVALAAAVKHFESKLMIADRRLEASEFLAGDRFTLADVQFGHVLYRYFDIKIDRTGGLNNLTRYYNDLTNRPAYREHVMVSYKELVATM